MSTQIILRAITYVVPIFETPSVLSLVDSGVYAAFRSPTFVVMISTIDVLHNCCLSM